MAFMWPFVLVFGLAFQYQGFTYSVIYATLMVAASLFVLARWGKKVHSTYLFVLWFMLLIITYHSFSIYMLPHQADLAKQCLALLNQEFRPEDTHFRKEFKDIENAEDFYMFLKGPIAGVLYSAYDKYIRMVWSGNFGGGWVSAHAGDHVVPPQPSTIDPPQPMPL